LKGLKYEEQIDDKRPGKFIDCLDSLEILKALTFWVSRKEQYVFTVILGFMAVGH